MDIRILTGSRAESSQSSCGISQEFQRNLHDPVFLFRNLLPPFAENCILGPSTALRPDIIH